MSSKDTEKEKEKIETKGAYSFDLHDAIRDVRKALGSGAHPSVVQNQLSSLFDVLAPEIREAVDERWEEKEEEWADYEERLDLIKGDSIADEVAEPEAVLRLSLEGFEESPWYFDFEGKVKVDPRDEKARELIEGSEEADFEDYDWDECYGRSYIASDGVRESYFVDYYDAERKMKQFKSELEAQLPDDDYGRLRALFRIVVDALDNHGELRKWRDVEYGKV